MPNNTYRFFTIAISLALLLSACSEKKVTPTFAPPPEPTIQAGDETSTSMPVADVTPTSEPYIPHVLSICLGQEPASLFLYGDASGAAKSVFEAIYDGPYDTRNFEFQPVILERIPSLKNGDARLESIQVNPGDLVVDSGGNWANLTEGVSYRPTGCTSSECAQTYQGNEPVMMDRLVVRFKLLPEIRWSDGTPLKGDDSVYSYEVAKSLFPAYRPELINLTQTYTAIDDTTVEWSGPPGYQNSRYSSFFFSPLPRHAWGILTPEELATAPISSQTPIGWGPYIIDEWVPGDHISLSKNPIYFRATEGLPKFDKLVYRFVPDGMQALDALLAGECHLADGNTLLETQADTLFELQASGQLTVTVQAGTSWEQAAFDLAPIDEKRPRLFAQKEVRQAIAQCIDRQRIADELFFGRSFVPDSYVLPDHPLYNPDVKRYPFDPSKASELLTSSGWADLDGDPQTPRTAQGVPGISDGTPLEFTYLSTQDKEKQLAAQIVQETLSQCGVKVNIQLLEFAELLAPGPQGPVFGRQFDMAGFGWMTTLEPPCSLYRGDEIPGPYPTFPKGWGGANATGFNNAEFDAACNLSAVSFEEAPEYTAAHQQAQALFAEELPAIPLYARIRLVASRPDLCGVMAADPLENALWNLENFTEGEGCP